MCERDNCTNPLSEALHLPSGQPSSHHLLLFSVLLKLLLCNTFLLMSAGICLHLESQGFLHSCNYVCINAKLSIMGLRETMVNCRNPIKLQELELQKEKEKRISTPFEQGAYVDFSDYRY